MKNKKTYERMFVCIVMLLLCFPLLLGTLSKITDKQLDLKLAGNFDTYTKPEFTLEKFASGEYQSKFESWWNENFATRSFLIYEYNQLR